MNIKTFYAYNSICPVCERQLDLSAQISILALEPADQDVVMLGEIVYDFTRSKFKKIGYYSSDQYRDMMDKIHKSASKSFSLNKIFHPRLNLSKLSKLISPWDIYHYDVKFSRTCNKRKHMYYYESHMLFDGAIADSVEFNDEVLLIHNKVIINSFNNNIIKTTIRSMDKKDEAARELPYININKWNIKKAKDLNNQIDKYTLLV